MRYALYPSMFNFDTEVKWVSEIRVMSILLSQVLTGIRVKLLVFHLGSWFS